MNIAKILKNVPKGTKLYCTIFGDVELLSVQNDLKHPIRVSLCDRDMLESFTEEGKYNEEHPNGECVLFPSKENRDWNTFRVINPGDIIFYEGMLYLMKNHNTVLFSYDTIRDKTGCGYKWEVPEDYISANKKQKEKLFEKLKERGFEYNPIDVSIKEIEKEDKISYEFKPFDKVLVRNEDNEPWSIQFFGYYDMIAKDEAPYVCLGNSMCIADTFKQCIPFEGNEKLLGHYDKV